jgi:hypothetical protein
MANVNPSWLGVPSSIPSSIPSQITIAGTNTTVDIVPRIFRNVSPIGAGGTALSNGDNTATTIFTSPTVEAGTYQVVVGYEIENDGTVVAWSSAETMTLYIGGTNVSIYPLLSLQPAYVNNFSAANDVIYMTLTGLVTVTASSTLTCQIIRNGVPTTNKQGSVYLFTAQKIA